MHNSQHTHNAETTYPTQNGALPSTQKPVRLNKGQLLEVTLRVLEEHFIHSITPLQTHWLIDKSSHCAFLAETESLFAHLKTFAFDTVQIDLSRSIVDSAITIFRQRKAHKVIIEFGQIVMTPEGSLYLRTSDGVWVFHKGKNVAIFPETLSHEIAFITPKHSPPLRSLISHNVDKQTVFKLFELINIPIDSQLLVITWMIQSWLPHCQKILLELVGESRCGKSSALLILKKLIDNSTLEYTRTTPQTSKAVHLLAQQHTLISLDQVDELNSKVQNALLYLMKVDIISWSQKRQQHETNLEVRNSVILNSVDSVVTEPKLADSTITIELPPIANVHQRCLNKESGQLLISIYHALIAILGDVHASQDDWTDSMHHRDQSLGMNTFCNIGCAVAKSLGHDESFFWQQFEANQQSRFDIALEELPVAYAIKKYTQQLSTLSVEETVGKLSKILVQYKPEWCNDNDWPVNPRQFGEALRKAQPILKQHKIFLEPQGKRGGNRHWRISLPL